MKTSNGAKLQTKWYISIKKYSNSKLCIQRSIQILFFSVLLFEMVKREETLLNVMQSVTKNIRSILFTALLAIILVYLFSIVGFVFFQEDFLIEAEDLPSAPSTSCQGKFIYMLPFSSQGPLKKWSEHSKLTMIKIPRIFKVLMWS